MPDNQTAEETPDSRSDIFALEWIRVRELWNRMKSSVLDEGERKRIDELLKEHENPCSDKAAGSAEWCELNVVEIAIGAQLDVDQLEIEYDAVLARARARKLSGLVDLEACVSDFKKRDLNAFSLQARRERYLQLLYRVHSDLVLRRTERRFRRAALKTLLNTGRILGIASLILIGAGFFALDTVFSKTCGFAEAFSAGTTCVENPILYFALLMIVIATLGAMGAYFSRALSFREHAESISFTNFLQDFEVASLWLRLVYGAIGAVILFFLLWGGVVAGSVFPLLAETADWQPEYAKLMVWSFIAGFSERLIPDLLARTEGRATETKPAEAPTPKPPIS